MNKIETQGFDAFSNDYHNLLSESLKNLSEFGSEYFSEYKIKTVKDSLKILPENILDFGCGDGLSCQFFRKHLPDSNLTGVDVSQECIKVAQKRDIQNSSFLYYDGEKLPFEDESFDIVFSACVFHHIEKKKHLSVIKELNRVLKKGGKVFIFEHNPLNPFTRKVVKDCVFDEGVELIHASDFKKKFKLTSFDSTRISYTLFFPRYKIFKNMFSLEKYFTKIPIGAQYFLEAIKD